MSQWNLIKPLGNGVTKMLQLDSKAADGFKHSWRISGLQDKDTLRGCPVRTIRKLFMSCCLENPTNHWKHLPRCKNALCEMAKSFRWTICRAMFDMKAVGITVSLSSCYDFNYVVIHHLLITCTYLRMITVVAQCY